MFEKKNLLQVFLLALGTVFVFVVVTNAALYIETDQYIYEAAASAPQTGVVLILGAAILQDGSLTTLFKDRANTAIALYKAKKASKILVSGDNGALTYNEVNPAKKYLITQGIPEQDIFLDHAGFDTYSSMYRARDVFGVKSLLITSQSFHLPRAVFIARALGIRAYGVRADVGSVLIKNYIREVFANEKALLDLVFARVPKYLGEQIPISGDGRNYP